MSRGRQKCWMFPNALGGIVFDPNDDSDAGYIFEKLRDWASRVPEGSTIEITSKWFSKRQLSEMGEHDGE